MRRPMQARPYATLSLDCASRGSGSDWWRPMESGLCRQSSITCSSCLTPDNLSRREIVGSSSPPCKRECRGCDWSHSTSSPSPRSRTTGSGEELQVIWELEPGAAVLERASMPELDELRRARPPRCLPRRRPLGRRVAGGRQRAAGAVPQRHRDRGLPARPARARHPDAAGQPADRRRRGPRQDHRGRPGRAGADPPPPRPHGARSSARRRCRSSGGTRCATSSASSSASSTATLHEGAAPQPRHPRQPVDALPAPHHLASTSSSASARCGCSARRCPAPGEPAYPRRFDLLIVDEAHNVAPSGRGPIRDRLAAHRRRSGRWRRTSSTSCS